MNHIRIPDWQSSRGYLFSCIAKKNDHAASYGYSLECEAKDVWMLKPKDGQQW